MKKIRIAFALGFFVTLLSLVAAAEVEGIKLSRDNLKVELIDSDEKLFSSAKQWTFPGACYKRLDA